MIRYEPDFPPDLRPIVEPVLNRWIGLVPTWCQEFIVRYDHRQDGRMATITDYPSRWVVLIVTPGWVGCVEAERENALVHELVHAGVEPLVSAARRVMENATDEGSPIRNMAAALLEDGMEASVEDLARAIVRVAA